MLEIMATPKVVVVDYGVGNLLSVINALEQNGSEVVLTADPDIVVRSSHVILPGVGAFGMAMNNLKALGLVDAIRTFASHGGHLLGICLGMQLLMTQSDEFGFNQGLDIIDGSVQKIPSSAQAKVPHIGWSQLNIGPDHNDWSHSILEETSPKTSMYFVHSYMVMPTQRQVRLADSTFGDAIVAAVVRQDNVVGCQFHPEKSGLPGLNILRKFCES